MICKCYGLWYDLQFKGYHVEWKEEDEGEQ